jgi:hypothetical protein
MTKLLAAQTGQLVACAFAARVAPSCVAKCVPTSLRFPLGVQATATVATVAAAPWNRPAACLLTAGWQIAEFQERIELLEMDKEVLVLERDELCKALAERSAQMEDLSKQLQSLRGLDQRHITEAEARESLEARASALREEVRGDL